MSKRVRQRGRVHEYVREVEPEARVICFWLNTNQKEQDRATTAKGLFRQIVLLDFLKVILIKVMPVAMEIEVKSKVLVEISRKESNKKYTKTIIRWT